MTNEISASPTYLFVKQSKDELASFGLVGALRVIVNNDGYLDLVGYKDDPGIEDGRVGEILDMPIYLVPDIFVRGNAQVQAIEEGLPANYGLEDVV